MIVLLPIGTAVMIRRVPVYSLVPIAFKLAAVALMAGYPLTAARHAEVAGRLKAASIKS